MSSTPRSLLSAFALCAALAACSGTTPGTADTGTAPALDAAAAQPDAGPTCFTDPKTHVEIINACTTSQGLEKNPVLPLMTDAGLPPLP